MKNIIEFEIEFLDKHGHISIFHNCELIKNIDTAGHIKLELTSVNFQNQLSITADVEIKIGWITMFGIGKEKLVYQGVCVGNNEQYQGQELLPGYQWQLDYTYPVFTWLHLTLGHGWLVGE